MWVWEKESNLFSQNHSLIKIMTNSLNFTNSRKILKWTKRKLIRLKLNFTKLDLTLFQTNLPTKTTFLSTRIEFCVFELMGCWKMWRMTCFSISSNRIEIKIIQNQSNRGNFSFYNHIDECLMRRIVNVGWVNAT